MSSLAFRVQSKVGRFSLSLTPESTFSELQEMLAEKTRVPPSTQKIMLGYPPKEIKYDPSSTLSSLNIHSGDTLIVDEKRNEGEAIKTTGREVIRTAKGEPSAGVAVASLTSTRRIGRIREESDDDKAKPTEVQDRYWIFARASSSDNIIGKWLVFKHYAYLDQTWERIRDAVLSGSLGGCKVAKTSTARYNPSGGGPGPCVEGVICVYTGEDDMEEIGFKLIEMVQQDIRYKTDAATRSGLYAHAGVGKTSIKTIYWNAGKPSYVRSGASCSGRGKKSIEDIWKINVVHGPEPVCSEAVYGKWIVPLKREELTDYWHRLKEKVESKFDRFGVIKMICPPRPVFHIFTSKEDKDSVGKKLIEIVHRDIEYAVSGKHSSHSAASSTEILHWDGSQEPLTKRIKLF